MTTFETIEKHETEFGDNRFLQVARKRANSEESSTAFIMVTHGYVSTDGTRRYKTTLTLPPDENLVRFLGDALQQLLGTSKDTVEISEETAQRALVELNALIERTKDEDPDPLSDAAFEAKNELEHALQDGDDP